MQKGKKAKTGASSNEGMMVELPKNKILPVSDTEYFPLSVDRGRHVLDDVIGKIKKKTEWQGPAGVLFTLGCTAITTNFQDAIGISKDVWKALAIMIGAMTAFLIIKSLYYNLKYKGINSKTVIERLRNPQE